MKKIYIILLIIPFLIMSGCGTNKPKKQTRSHAELPVDSTEDMFGCYKRINFPEQITKKMNSIEPWPAKHQWFCFDYEGNMYSLSQSNDAVYTEEDLWKAFKKLPKDITYTIPKKGIVITVQKSAKQKILWSTRIIKGYFLIIGGKHIPDGSLVMSLYSPKVKKHIYHRYLKVI